MPDGGCIVNVTSDAAVEPYEGWGGYGSSKAALEQVTRSSPPSTRRCASTPSTRATCARRCTRRRSRARTSPTARRPRRACPGLLALIEGACRAGATAPRDLAGAGGGRLTALAFDLPAALEAHEPPEARGLRRDDVRLLVGPARDGAIAHARFADLPDVLDAGDLLVVNISATLPAAVSARRARTAGRVAVHFATPGAAAWADGWWVVELRSARRRAPAARGRAGERARARRRRRARAGRAVRVGGAAVAARAVERAGTVTDVPRAPRAPDPLRLRAEPRGRSTAYQNVYATTPGSAEMPSAGRPFTPELITRLVARGVLVAPITLHTGVSSPERHEPPLPERYEVPERPPGSSTPCATGAAASIAVGTTVVRALETVASSPTER